MIKAGFVRNLVAGAVTSIALATAATAATFTVVGGTPGTLPTDFDAQMMAGPQPLPAVGDPVSVFTGSTTPFAGGQGLFLSAASQLTFTYLGKEAGATNTLSQMQLGSTILSNTASNRGASVTVGQSSGLVDFLFSTLEGAWEDINGNATNGETLSIANGGTSDFSNLKIGFGLVFNNGRSVLAFFGDGRGDADFDDMVVRIDAVPLPASALLLLGAIGGLGALRMRKKAAA